MAQAVGYCESVMIPSTHQAEAESLLEQREWLQAILAVTADAIVATDQDDKIKFMNSAAEKLTGWKGEEALSRRKADVFKLARPSVLVRRDGIKCHITETTAPIHTAGCVTGRVSIIHDHTGRHHRENQLAEANKFAAVGKMAGQVAHDFNNLLVVILGYSEMMLAEPLVDAENTLRLRQISEATTKAAGLTRKLLVASSAARSCDAL